MNDCMELESKICKVKDLALVLDEYLTETGLENADRLGPSITMSTLLACEAAQLIVVFESYLAGKKAA